MQEIQTIDQDLRNLVSDFLYREAELLDTGKFREWLDNIAPDIQYKMPLRVTKERAAGSGILEKMANFDEDWLSLEMRVLRFETEYAWSEDPPSRTKHVVSNIRIERGEREDELKVKSYLLLYRFRGDNPGYDLLSAERHDVLRLDKSRNIKLVKRMIALDQTTLNTMNLALFL
jgi:3-phenylpropionate/cinnamic acid dioxygenase small subunit